MLYEDGTFVPAQPRDPRNFSHYLLHFRTVQHPQRIRAIFNTFTPPETGLNIELETYLPELYYKYGYIEEGNTMVRALASPQKQRREYPENAFALISALTTGYMGIVPHAPRNLVTTYSRIVDKAFQAEVQHLPVFDNQIGVKHEKGTETTFTNHSGGPIKWRACFLLDTRYLKINGKKHLAQQEIDVMGNTWSWVEVGVFDGQTLTIGK